MKKTLYLSSIYLLAFLISACDSNQQTTTKESDYLDPNPSHETETVLEEKEQKSNKEWEENQGFTLGGKMATCELMETDKICTEIFSIEDRFASKCRDEGHKVIQCDCHKFLCQTKDGQPLPFDPM